MGWFTEENLPPNTAGFGWWGPMAMAAIRGEDVPVTFDAPRDDVWRRGVGHDAG